ncbi:MAG: efflux RND transporter periplasmic adaptor subunit [bacterium]
MLKNKKIMVTAGLVAASVLILVVMGSVISGCKKRKDQRKPAPEQKSSTMAVRVYKTSRANFKDMLTVLGNVEGGSQVDLNFRKEGIISVFHYKAGDLVEKGSTIAELESREDELKMQQAKLEYDQHQKLFEAGVIIKAKLQQARIAFQQAGEEYSKNLLRAPIDGMLATVEYREGEVVNPTAKILSIFDIAKMIVKIGITENDINKLSKGQSAHVIIDALPDMVYDGVIQNINPSIDELMRMMTAEIAVDNPDKLILPGMFARAEIIIYNEENALLIPSLAFRKINDDYIVYVAGEDKKISKRNINIGYISRDYAVVSEGLNENELIVIEKPDNIQEDIVVDIMTIDEYKPDTPHNQNVQTQP